MIEPPKLEGLRAEIVRLKAKANAITELPSLTPVDRIHFEEILSLIYEIEDYAERLQRPGEKWMEAKMPNPHDLLGTVKPKPKPRPQPVPRPWP